LRKRVSLRSPVRENRTPGSVRGASGNRRPYRDVRQAKLGASCGVQVPAEQGLTNHSYRVWQLWRKPRGRAERPRGSVHRAPRSPQGSPHSPKLETAPLKSVMPMAMALTLQKPRQRTRFGERPEGLPGSPLERGRRGEKRQELGRPWRFQRAGTPWQGLRLRSHAGGKPSIHGRPDPHPRGKSKPVGQSNHTEPGRDPAGSQIRL
jgi:hypothetical protein